MTSVLSVRNLTKQYNLGAVRVHALRGVDGRLGDDVSDAQPVEGTGRDAPSEVQGAVP